MGKKITQLDANEIPYTGTEQVAIVEDLETRRGSLSSITNYLSSADYGGSQPLASPHKDNKFSTTQTINAALSVTGGKISFDANAACLGATAAGGSVLGGSTHVNSGACSTIAGGKSNTILGSYSTVAGGGANRIICRHL